MKDYLSRLCGNKRSLVLILAAHFFSIPTWATVLPANGTEEDSPRLGDGYDSVFKTKKWGCVKGRVEEDVNQSISSELQFASNLSLDSIVNTLEVGPQLSLNKYFFNLRANAQLMNAHSASETSTTFHFFWRGTGKTKSLDHNTELVPGITGIEGIKHLDDENADQGDALVHIRAACGDEFVSEIRYGAYLIVTLKINFATTEDKRRFDSEIQAGLESVLASSSAAGPSKPQNLKPDDAKSLSSSIGGKLIDLDRKHDLRSSSVEVIINQVGGDPTAMRTILGSSAISGKLITECTGTNDLPKCVAGFSEAVEYAKDFLASLASADRNLWSPMVYLTTPYTSVLSLSGSELFLLSEDQVISSDLERQIEQLDLFLEKVRAIEHKASNLLKSIQNDFYRVSPDVYLAISEIKQKAQQVHIDIKNGIYHNCMRKSSTCLDKIEAFQENYPYPYRLDIDERYLNLKPTDGGVEHLPPVVGSTKGGKPFDHIEFLQEPSQRSIVEIALHGANRPHQLVVTLDDYTILSVGSDSDDQQTYFLNPYDPNGIPIPMGPPTRKAVHSLTLQSDEVVSYLEAHAGKVEGRDRVVYLKICKSNAKFSPQQSCIASGVPASDERLKTKHTFGNHERLIGFHGRQGREIDRLGFIVTTKSSLVPDL